MSEEPLFKPSPEHELLSRNVGEWIVECAYHTIPGEEPLKVQGTEKSEMMGPFWVVGRFEADMLGSPIIGQAVTGFDPVKKVFVSTWKDSYTPFHYTFEGTLSEDGNILTVTGENYDPMRQANSTYQTVTEYLSDSERILSLSVVSDDGETPILRYHYRRK